MARAFCAFAVSMSRSARSKSLKVMKKVAALVLKPASIRL